MHAVFAYPVYGFIAYITIMVSAFVGYHTLPAAPLILGFIARSMSAYLCLVICAAYGTIASAILRLFGLHYRYGQWSTARAFKYTGKYMIGVEFEIEGNGEKVLDSTRPAVIVGNHQSELDILMLGTLFPRGCSVTAKKSLAKTPFLGWFMLLSGTVFIDRADRAQAMQAFEGAAKVMKTQQQDVFMFPEGTRSYSTEPTLLPFKKGAFHMAVQSQVPIIPAVAENYSYVFNIKAKRFNPGKVRIRVLDPIETKGKTAADVDALTKQCRDAMLAALVDMSHDHEAKTEGNVLDKKQS